MSAGLVKFIATFGFVGYSPVAPGTMGSLCGAVMAYGLAPLQGWILAGGMLVGFAACRPAEACFKKKDPGSFVLDEVCGMMLAVFAVPTEIAFYVSAFVLFRLFDVWKPWPISWIQKREASPFSIMWDDVAAGALANIGVRVLILFFF